MATIIRKNERSWAIDIISKINSITARNDLKIKRAGGENTISTGRGNRMFPDVVLYGNIEQSVILQGWELKMPDVPIEDETFIKDAQRKAIALNLNSCLIWNFTYAVLYLRNQNNYFTKVKQWADTSHIKTREDVLTYRDDWEKLLEKIILEINNLFVSGRFRQSSLGDAISNTTISTLLDRNKVLVAEHLRNCALRDAVMAAFIDNWWLNVHAEYEHDESDKYKAYAKSVILNWANRILFAHIIKYRQNAALAINNISFETSPAQANNIFKGITEKCDFYNVFSPIKYNEVIPELSWQDFVELSMFLKDNNIDQLEQSALQSILESSVSISKREINGQFTTPEILARLLVELTIRDWSKPILDCCCGTGTISKAAVVLKKEKFSPREAVETVWASDKNQYPLQVANISMTDSDTINLANRIFQHNALSLKVGEEVSITDPETGKLMKLVLPEFGAITSNLPFVPFEIIPPDDKYYITSDSLYDSLDGRSDLYCYISLKASELIEKDGMLGIITSNSWLGTQTGKKYIESILKRFDLMQVHISGKGRWFKNADVVTTIIILRKKSNQTAKTQFFLWNKSLEQIEADRENERKLINSALLGQEIDPDVTKVSTYSKEQMDSLLALKISYNALFHQVSWLLGVTDKIIPIDTAFDVFRGSRRGWDALFYPKAGEHHIESKYLKKVLINARNINTLIAEPDSDAFCCDDSISVLKNTGMIGALEWIEKFADQKNGVGRPLPEVLKRKNMQWYELQDNEVAEIFTMMNPDKRLFFAMFENPSFVNQRLIGLKQKSDFNDLALNHALLNSMFTMFYIEASGFGRGLGVLDINKESIANCFMLNPNLVSKTDRAKILAAFETLKTRQIMNTLDELYQPDRELFEHAVFKAFGIDECFERVRHSLVSLQRTRATARE